MPNIEPSDVYARLELVLAELEVLRQELGRPRDRKGDLTVNGAEPREVFFEVLALFRKCDRLCFERTGEQAALPHPPGPGEIQPMHVKSVVDAALTRLARVKEKLGVADAPEPPAVGPGKRPSDCLMLAARANRQLNLLLEQPFSPSDVYQLITLGVGYAARLLGRFPDARAPQLPPYERKKRPGDVYRRLVGCMGLLRNLSVGSGLSSLELGPPSIEDDDVTPSDCYDLASIVIAELAHLHWRAGNLPPPTVSDFYEAGHKIPAHSYQVAGHLMGYLTALDAAVQGNRDWLK